MVSKCDTGKKVLKWDTYSISYSIGSIAYSVALHIAWRCIDYNLKVCAPM